MSNLVRERPKVSPDEFDDLFWPADTPDSLRRMMWFHDQYTARQTISGKMLHSAWLYAMGQVRELTMGLQFEGVWPTDIRRLVVRVSLISASDAKNIAGQVWSDGPRAGILLRLPSIPEHDDFASAVVSYRRSRHGWRGGSTASTTASLFFRETICHEVSHLLTGSALHDAPFVRAEHICRTILGLDQIDPGIEAASAMFGAPVTRQAIAADAMLCELFGTEEQKAANPLTPDDPRVKTLAEAAGVSPEKLLATASPAKLLGRA